MLGYTPPAMACEVSSAVKWVLRPFYSLLPRSTRTDLHRLRRAVKSTYVRDYLFGRGRTRSLHSVWIELTHRCNCQCEMCYLHGTEAGRGLVRLGQSQEELTAAQLAAVFEQIGRAGARFVVLTGGEVFLRHDVLEIVDSARSANLEVSIVTNGSHVTPEAANRLVASGVATVSVSLDGPREIHDRIRKAKVFDSAMAAASPAGTATINS